jgi:hypothetical protein
MAMRNRNLLNYAAAATAALSWLFIINAPAAAGGNTRWHDEGKNLVTEIQTILIKTNQCNSIDDCVKRELVFFQPTGKGIEIEVYGVEEKEIVSAIVGKSAARIVVPGIEKIRVRFFRLSKKVELSRSNFFTDNSVLTFDIGGNYGKH